MNLKIKSASAKSIILFCTIFVLDFAFLGSLLAPIGTIGEEWRTVGILEANPNSYMQWMWTVLEFGILPTAAGLILCTIDFALQRRTRVKSQSPSLLIAGILSAVWGIYYSLAAYSSYVTAVGLANQWNVTGVNSSLQIIYVGYEGIGVLWLSLGVFLSVTSGYVKDALRQYRARSRSDASWALLSSSFYYYKYHKDYKKDRRNDGEYREIHCQLR